MLLAACFVRVRHHALIASRRPRKSSFKFLPSFSCKDTKLMPATMVVQPWRMRRAQSRNPLFPAPLLLLQLCISACTADGARLFWEVAASQNSPSMHALNYYQKFMVNRKCLGLPMNVFLSKCPPTTFQPVLRLRLRLLPHGDLLVPVMVTGRSTQMKLNSSPE